VRLVSRARLVLGRNPHLGTVMEQVAAAHGDRRLVEEEGGRTLTARQASDLVDRWAGGIAAKVEPGDGVVIVTPNGYDQLLLCVAAARAGAVPAPVSDRLRQREVDGIVADSRAAMVLRSADEVAGAEPLRQARPAEPGAVGARFFTSGTTGRPKGAELSHRALVGQVSAAAAFPSPAQVEVVVALPVAHIMGFAVLLGLACAGIPVYQLPKFRAGDVLDAIESRRATGFVGVPAMYRMLLDAGAEQRDLASVRVWGSGADVLPEDVAGRFKRMGAAVHLPLVGDVGQASVVEGYGMVEVGAGAVGFRVSPPYLPPGFGGGLVLPSPSYRFRIVGDDGRDVRPGQVGELWVRGPGVLSGYQGDEEATRAVVTEDGWLRTGDLARRGLFGTFALTGRAKDVVKSGGYSVYAVEVESSLEEHPDVLEAAVVGLPDERRGEVPAAAVRVRDGATVTPDELVAWAAERMAGYKVPRTIRFVDDLPRTGTQKVRRNAVRELLTGPAERGGRR
jgi:long-chain acyl-CoA synthetase